jgi:hypothetical protein
MASGVPSVIARSGGRVLDRLDFGRRLCYAFFRLVLCKFFRQFEQAGVPSLQRTGSSLMPHRSLSLLLALLSLALLVGANVSSEAQPTAMEARADSAVITVVSSPIRQGNAANGWNARTEEEDKPDCFIQTKWMTVWRQEASSVFTASAVIYRTHRACAAPPRGPPVM